MKRKQRVVAVIAVVRTCHFFIYVGSVNKHSSTPGIDEISQGGGSRQDFRIVLE